MCWSAQYRVRGVPGNRLIRQRIAHACEPAESTDLTVEPIAARSGCGAVETLRHHFRRVVGTTPTGYRRTFSRVASGTESSWLPPGPSPRYSSRKALR